MMRSLGYWLLSGTITLGSVAAFAADTKTAYPTCTTTPTDADRKAAQGAFTAGQGSFNEADYTTAIMYWRDAYRRDCTAHKLLLNLARAYELKGERADAIASLETYLARKTDDPDAEQIQRRIQNLKAQLTPAAPAATPAAAAQPAPVATAAAEPQPTGPQTRLNWPPLAIAGGGVVLAVVGGVIYAGGKSKLDEAEKICPDRSCPPQLATQTKVTNQAIADAQQKGNDGRAQANLGGALLFVGVAAVIGGGVWFAVAPRKPASASAHTALMLGANTSIEPTIARGFAGVSLGGSF
jgi:tetratricopeptide (TPR) repeat protein